VTSKLRCGCFVTLATPSTPLHSHLTSVDHPIPPPQSPTTHPGFPLPTWWTRLALECPLRPLNISRSRPVSYARADLVPPGSAHWQWRSACVHCGRLDRLDLVPHCADCLCSGVYSNVRQSSQKRRGVPPIVLCMPRCRDHAGIR
jgi:hypothetical protein